MTPFTVDEFLGVFRAYNLGVWPAQLVLFAAALVAVGLAQARTRSGRSAAGLLLAALWLWMGAVYHLAYFATINPAAYLFGGLFILQGGLLAHATWRRRLTFERRGGVSQGVGWVLVVYALVVYPLIGRSIGHTWPAAPTFGAPCPTTIFTLGLLLWAEPPVPMRLLLIPLAWALVGTSAVWVFGMVEDLALPLAGVLAALLILRRNRRPAPAAKPTNLRPALPLLALVLALPAAASPPVASGDDATADSVATRIRQRLAEPDAGLLSPEPVARFYARREYTPAWSQPAGGDLDSRALIRAIGGLRTHGLRPEACRATRIEGELRRLTGDGGDTSPADLAELDLLLTDAFLTCARQLARGRIDPRRVHPGWSLPPRAANEVAALEAALDDGDIATAFAGMAPAGVAYLSLRGALTRYHSIEAAGGWPTLPEGPPIRPGDRGEAVARLRERLAAEAPLPAADSADFYDGPLEAAVRAFQRSHGLVEDGIVGRDTRAALNVTATARREQLELALERLRWLPDDLGWRHIRVSIPAFELALVEHGRPVLSMRIVGGRADWPTPVFSARMTSVVLSPYWNIPASIAEQEVVPEVRRDPDYLARNRIRVVAGYGEAERTISPSTIDWGRYDPRRSPFRLRQEPGPGNALGAVKFLFPNPYSTYLHDTPARSLFAEPVRAFSHGCMRAEKPVELAVLLLADPGWDERAIRDAIAGGVERHVTLPDPVPVHVLYQTAWIDAAGVLQFRDDLYGHDRRLARALDSSEATVAEPPSGECGADAESGE